MKKISYAILGSVMMASAALADTSPAPIGAPAAPNSACNFSGFYIGGAIGYGSGKGTDTRETTRAGAPVPSEKLKTDLSLNGMNGGVFLGFGKELGASRVYLGLEVAYMLDGAKGKMSLGTTDIEMKKKGGVELAARLGVALNNSLPYLKLGWSNTKVEGTQTVPDVSIQPPAPAQLLKQKILNKRLSGYIMGAGIDVKLSRHVVAGLEYTYTCYRQKSARTALGSLAPIDVVTSDNNRNTKIKLNDNKFRLRIAYSF